MNLAVVAVDVGSSVLELVEREITETRDLGTIMLHLIPGGFLAFMMDGRCVLAGTAADLEGAGYEPEEEPLLEAAV